MGTKESAMKTPLFNFQRPLFSQHGEAHSGQSLLHSREARQVLQDIATLIVPLPCSSEEAGTRICQPFFTFSQSSYFSICPTHCG